MDRRVMRHSRTFEPDTWTEVANHLHVTDLSILSATCRSFRRLLSDDSIWRHAFLHDITLHTDDTNMLRILHAPRPFHRSWRFLYATALGKHQAGSPVCSSLLPPTDTDMTCVLLFPLLLSDPIVSYCIRQPEKHIELFRVGGFVIDTSKLLLTAKLALALAPLQLMTVLDNTLDTSIVACLLTNVRPGVWIAGTPYAFFLDIPCLVKMSAWYSSLILLWSSCLE
ncbi:hypothetical protein ZWY2020_054140 [Hordeum vulgare]|nr:hypothetical protein ZWY2020_054140 [Hordeum vulgare]